MFKWLHSLFKTAETVNHVEMYFNTYAEIYKGGFAKVLTDKCLYVKRDNMWIKKSEDVRVTNLDTVAMLDSAVRAELAKKKHDIRVER